MRVLVDGVPVYESAIEKGNSVAVVSDFFRAAAACGSEAVQVCWHDLKCYFIFS